MNSSYAPSHLVLWISNIPHLSGTLNRVHHEFYLSHGAYWNDYSRSLLPFPFIIAVIGWIITLLLGTYFSFSCCFRAGKYSITRFDMDNVDRVTKISITAFRDLLSKFYVIFCFLTLLSDHILFLGNSFLSRGVNRFDSSISFMMDVVVKISNSGIDLLKSGKNIVDAFENAQDTCVYADGLGDNAYDYVSKVEYYNNLLSGLPSTVEAFGKDYNDWAVNKRNSSVWILYGVVFLVTGLYLAAVKCQSQVILRFAIFSSIVIICAYILLCTLEMIIMVSYYILIWLRAPI